MTPLLCMTDVIFMQSDDDSPKPPDDGNVEYVLWSGFEHFCFAQMMKAV